MKNLIALVKREAGQTIGIVFCVAALIWIYGCPSKTMSLTDSGRLVTRPEIQMELETFMKLAEIRYADLDRQDAFKQAVVNAAVLTTQTGAINPMGVLAILLGGLGVSATVDNVRKRADIKKLNAK